MNKLLSRYTEFLLATTNPGKTWVSVRFVLHWLTLPIKLLVIGSLGGYQIVRNNFKKSKPIPALPSLKTKQAFFQKIKNNLPLWVSESATVYAPRVPANMQPDGTNHNYDHQCSRHGTYTFLTNRLGEETVTGLGYFMQARYLARGYKMNALDGSTLFNATTTSGDMLTGLSLAMLTLPKIDKTEITFEKYDQLVGHIIENDYSLLEGGFPGNDSPGGALWNKLYAEAGNRSEYIKMKSERGMWQPGLETVGAQALTVLAALRIAERRNGNRHAGEEYRKLLWKYGYGLLSLFPTAFIDSRRGYFNDHNCMVNLYVLSKLSSSRFGRAFWKIPMVFTWALSRNWYNGYFTGLLNDAHPKTVKQEYVDACLGFLYQEEPNTHHHQGRESVPADAAPVSYNSLNSDEFTPDVPQNEMVEYSDVTTLVCTGLGFYACAIMLEKEPKSLLS